MKKIWQAVIGFILGALAIFFLIGRNKTKELKKELATIEQTLKQLDEGRVPEDIKRDVKEKFKKRLEEIHDEVKDMEPEHHMRELASDVDRLLRGF